MHGVYDSGENKQLVSIVCDMIKLRNSGFDPRAIHDFLRKFYVSRLDSKSINDLLVHMVKQDRSFEYTGEANEMAIREHVMGKHVFHFSGETLFSSRFNKFEEELSDVDSS